MSGVYSVWTQIVDDYTTPENIDAYGSVHDVLEEQEDDDTGTPNKQFCDGQTSKTPPRYAQDNMIGIYTRSREAAESISQFLREDLAQRISSGDLVISKVPVWGASFGIEIAPEIQLVIDDGDEVVETYFRRTRSADSPMSDYGHAMFADDAEAIEQYGDNEWKFEATVNNSKDIDDLIDIIKEAWEESQESGDFGSGSVGVLEDLSSSEIASSFSPKDIVTTAESWDDGDLVQWFWEKVAEPNDIFAIRLYDGAVVFDETLIGLI